MSDMIIYMLGVLMMNVSASVLLPIIFLPKNDKYKKAKHVKHTESVDCHWSEKALKIW